MEHVIEIIQNSMSHDGHDINEEIEIPIDELDTATLRTLQKYVEVSIQSFMKMIS